MSSSHYSGSGGGSDSKDSGVGMKVKEVEVTANVAWSPAENAPIYLAAGTAAQQLDATFNTSSALEMYRLNLDESGHGLPKAVSLPVDNRFHKLVWGKTAASHRYALLMRQAKNPFSGRVSRLPLLGVCRQPAIQNQSKNRHFRIASS